MENIGTQIRDNPNLSFNVRYAPLPPPGKVYTQNIGRRRISSAQWEATEWDLAECGRIVDVESYVRRALRTQLDLFLKEGYEFNGPNRQRSEYVSKRLSQIETATDTPFPILLGIPYMPTTSIDCCRELRK